MIIYDVINCFFKTSYAANPDGKHAMATNNETAESNSSEPGEKSASSAVSDVSLVTTGTLRQRIFHEIGKKETAKADEILIETIQNFDKDRKKAWPIVLVVAIATFIIYVGYAAWQWEVKISGVTSQLLQKEKVDATSVLLAVSDLSSQGERSFFIASIIGLIICVVVWLGWAKSFQSSKTQAVENATRMLTVVAGKEKELTCLTAIVTTYETQIEDLKVRKKELDEEIEVSNSDQASHEKLEKLYEQRREIEEELKKKSVELEKTKETVQHQAECMQHAKEIEEEKQQLETQISNKEKRWKVQLDKEKCLRQQVEKDLEAAKQEIQKLKSKSWWPW